MDIELYRNPAAAMVPLHNTFRRLWFVRLRYLVPILVMKYVKCLTHFQDLLMCFKIKIIQILRIFGVFLGNVMNSNVYSRSSCSKTRFRVFKFITFHKNMNIETTHPLIFSLFFSFRPCATLFSDADLLKLCLSSVWSSPTSSPPLPFECL